MAERRVSGSTIDTPDEGKRPARPFAYVAVRNKNAPTVVYWLFLLFLFTLPFESADLGLNVGVSIAKILGLPFFAFYFLYYNPFFGQRSLPRPHPAVYWFIGYVAFYYVTAMFFSDPKHDGYIMARFYTFVQLLVLLWIIPDLLADPKIRKKALLVFSVSALALAISIIFNLPWVGTKMEYGRITALREDMNQLSATVGMAALVLIGINLKTVFKRLSSRILLALLTFPLLYVAVQTGSRTGTVAFVIGCMAYMLPFFESRLRGRSKRSVMVIVIAVSAVIVLIYLVAINPLVMDRWKGAYSEGDLASREVTFPVALQMIAERPLLGWHPVQAWYELGARIGHIGYSMDTHNLVLNLFVEGGILGALLFLAGLGVCFWSAWKGRQGDLGYMPLALLAAAFITNLGIPAQVWKPFWIAMALSLTTAAQDNMDWSRQPYRLFRVSV